MSYRKITPSGRGRQAFTMVEIMTAVAITTLIVFALVSMFNTSTKALLMGIKQKDVWESARATFGMISTDVEKVTEGGYARVGTNTDLRISMAALGPSLPPECVTLQNGVEICRELQDFYLLSKDGSRWDLNIYRVIRENADTGVGTLYRFQTNYTTFNLTSSENMDIDYSPISLTVNSNPFKWSNAEFADRASRMVDGVVHLRMVSYDNNGRALYPTNSPVLEYEITLNSFWFGGDALPAAVDLDMFVLEPDRINEFRAQSGPAARQAYMANHIGNIQMFRTRIPIRKDVPQLQLQ
jgi:hypothetical protein